VRFGSEAEVCVARQHVCFAANSDPESGPPQTAMSALPSKADICGATGHVCFGSKADMCGALADVGYGPSARPRIVGGTFTPIAGDTKRPPSLGEPSSKADVRAKT